jgi:hypothetical protein
LARVLSKDVFGETQLITGRIIPVAQINNASRSVISTLAEGYKRGGKLMYSILVFAQGFCIFFNCNFIQHMDRNLDRKEPI